MSINSKPKRIFLSVIMFVIVLLVVFYILFNSICLNKNCRNKSNFLNTDGNKIEYSTDLYCKTADSNKVCRIPDMSINYVENELIIDAVSGTEYKQVKELLKEYDADIIGYISVTDTYQIEFINDLTYEELSELKKKIRKENIISDVYFNKIYPVDNASGYYPNDKLWKDEWNETAGGKNWALEFIKAPEAWELLRHLEKHASEPVNIGVLEVGGIDYKHEDLKDNFQEKPLCNDAKDKEHGTAVSGIIGAGYDNGIGLTGVVPHVSLRAASWNAINNFDKGINIESNSMVYRVALAYLITTNNINQKTTIINVSLGSGILAYAASRGNEEAKKTLNDLNSDLEKFLQRILDQGYDFLICKCAGNNNATNDKSKRYSYIRADGDDENATCGYVRATEESIKKYKKRADYKLRLGSGNVNARYDVFSGITSSQIADRVIVVGSMNMNDSSHASEYSCSGPRVDILAPGEDIYVLEPDNKYSSSGGWGTSYSAPYVSGVAGLLLSVNPELSGVELKNILTDSATGEYTGFLNNKSYEYKALNAEEAVKMVTELGKPDNNSWKETLIQYLQNDSKVEEQYGYTWIYLDDDDIPELVEIGKGEARGVRIVNYSNGKANVTQLNRLFFYYIERENVLDNSEGNMGYYYDKIYKLQNGKMKKIAEGIFTNDVGDNGEIINEKYYWDDEPVSKEEYGKRLNELCPLKKAKEGYDYDKLLSVDQMIEKINDL